jgi:hypothetical protein
MWPEWSRRPFDQGIAGGYDDLVFMGSGSVYDGMVPAIAIERYLEEFPLDDFFRLWADTIIGVLAPTRQLDIRFEALPEGGRRLQDVQPPDGVEQKTEAIRRARLVRDRELIPA